MSIMFNEICINKGMLPKYTYFKLHDPAAHKYPEENMSAENIYYVQWNLYKYL